MAKGFTEAYTFATSDAWKNKIKVGLAKACYEVVNTTLTGSPPYTTTQVAKVVKARQIFNDLDKYLLPIAFLLALDTAINPDTASDSEIVARLLAIWHVFSETPMEQQT